MGRIGQMYMNWFNRGVERRRNELREQIKAGKLEPTVEALTHLADEASLRAQSSGALTPIPDFFDAQLSTAARQIAQQLKR